MISIVFTTHKYHPSHSDLPKTVDPPELGPAWWTAAER